MKLFSYYNTTINYPNKGDFVIQKKSSLKKNKSVTDFIDEFFDEEEFNKAVKLYHDDQSRLYWEFVSDLYDDLGINGNPKADLLYEIAYDKAHSGGCEEVYYMAKSLVDLIK